MRNGIVFELDLSEYMEHAVYFGQSNEERTEMNAQMKEGMIVFDIGANIGDTALNFAKRVGQNGKVHAFEPVDITFAKLKKNISLNPFDTISAHQIALSDQEENLLFGYSWNHNSSGIQMNKTTAIVGTETNNIAKATTLDSFVKTQNILKLDFIKIDVEGFEKYVLRGAIETLNKFKPVMYVEVSDVPLRIQNSSAEDLMRFISSFGYKMTEVKTGELIAFDRDYSGIHIDVLCIPHN
jgi:FkbM family methyltransferase